MKTLLKKLLTLIVALITTSNLMAATIYVSSSATGSNNGISWANAYTSLQTALNIAVSGDQIWVAKGTYKPTSDYGMGGGSRYYHFEMIEGVEIYGGFVGTESTVSMRSNYQLGEVNETVLSGDLASNDSWDCSFFDPWVGAIKGTTGADNCYHVIYNPDTRGLSSSAILDGFTITGGNANYYSSDSPHIKGGGMYNAVASPTIRNCTFTKNQAYIEKEGSSEVAAYGSCMFNDNSNPIVSNCLFVNNFDHTSTIYCQYGGITMSNCTITHNNSWQNHSGIYILQNEYPSSITNCTFSYNNGQGYGTALMNDNANNLTISGCSFIGNTARYYYNDSYGIGIVCNINSTNIGITNCIFKSNDITNADGNLGNGGAIYNGAFCENININNCVFSGNKASHGGAIANSTSTCTVTNSSFSNNTATVAGGASICYKATRWMDDNSGYIRFDNCAFWNNTSPIGNEFCSDGADAGGSCKIEINYSCFPNGTGDMVAASGATILATNNNIHSNPLFFNPSSDDLRVIKNSPCINAGYNSYNTASTDFRGQTRIQNSTIDIGAYEWSEGVDPTKIVIYVKYDATGKNDGTSWNNAYTSLQSALDAATANNDIYIAKGTYKPSSAYSLTNTPRYYHFELKNEVGIYGGFAGTETSLSQRTDFGYGGANETILSGDIGTTGVSTDNCLHVIYNPDSGITNTALLDGVTITGGNANNGGVTNEKRGGAIYMPSNSPTISNVIITGNYANYGGGAFNMSSSAIYNNCLFFNNSAIYGGAIMNFSSSALGFNNCTFYGNNATTHGGGVDNWSSALSYNNCIFWGNTSATGNQIYGYGNSTLTLNYSCFSTNSNEIATETGSSVLSTNNNITSNPLFVNAAAHDFRLTESSPCVNAGNNTYNKLSTDIRGQVRIQNSTIDMGAYERSSADCIVAIPDANFKTELLAITGLDANSNGEIECSEAAAYTGTINVDAKGIADLTGIESFTKITQLICSNNSLSALNLSANIDLTNLDCSFNLLTSLNVSFNTALKNINCYSNSITSLNVSGLTALTDLDCGFNQLSTLNLSTNRALLSLICNNNSLTSLNISALTSLTHLECYTNPLLTLDVSANVALTFLDCIEDQLSNLNVSSNKALETLYCYSNSITNLNALGLTHLKVIDCGDNQLSTLNLTTNTALQELYCNTNPLTSLDVSGLTSLTGIVCGHNNLTTINLSTNSDLRWLICDNNLLTSLDISMNPSLGVLECQNNSLTSLNVKNGNNTNISGSDFNATNNPNLTCIQVDNVSYSTANWTNKDAGASYNINCGTLTETPAIGKTTWLVYPNPSNGLVNFRFAPENGDKTTIDIFSITGELVYRVFEGTVEQGTEQTIQFTKPLAEGLYIYKMTNGTNVKTGRLIKMTGNN